MVNEKYKELELGMRFKNYTELCKFLGEKVRRGTAKEEQIKEYNKYFLFEELNGSALIITSIVDENGTMNKLTRTELLKTIIELNKTYGYKEFCSLLNERPEDDWYAQWLQVHNWRRFFDLRTDLYTIRILKIYDEPMEQYKDLFVVTPKHEINKHKTNEYILKETVKKLEVGMEFRTLDSFVKFLDLKISNSINKYDIFKDCLRYFNFELVKYSVFEMYLLRITEIRETPLTDEELNKLILEKEQEHSVSYEFNIYVNNLLKIIKDGEITYCQKNKATKKKNDEDDEDKKDSNNTTCKVIDLSRVNKLKLKLKHEA